MRRSWTQPLSAIWRVIAAIGVVLGIIEFVVNRVSNSSSPDAHGSPLLWAAFWTACAHGVVWRGAELTLWNGSEIGGGNIVLPRGWKAIVLSLSMTIPLAIVPPLYNAIFGSLIIPPNHVQGMVIVAISAAMGHILLYGTNSRFLPIAGLRNRIFPLGTGPIWERALLMELIYSVVHFASFVLVYRICTQPITGTDEISNLAIAFSAGGIWLLFVSAFIVVMYPELLVVSSWVLVRGVINATVLMMALTGGMLW